MRDDINFLTPFKKNTACKTFIIAEAGVHHSCSLSVAKRLIDAAADAGADVIKFQTYKANTLVTEWAPQYWLSSDESHATQFECFSQRDKFGFEEYGELSEYAQHKDIIFCSTPFDLQAVEWLEEIDVPFWKIASGDIDNFPLLEQVANTRKPILLSTGASNFSEINETIEFLKSKGVKELALLHCNLAYPTPNEEANLLRIIALQRRFPCHLIGYSDHTIPDQAVTIPVVAVALGAQIIEKHFTLDRSLPEDDHYHSVNPAMLRTMIQGIKIAEEAIHSNTEITKSESPARQYARRSLVAINDIPKGSILNLSMVSPKRPAGGITPARINQVLGCRTKKPVKKDEQIQWEFLERNPTL